MISTRVVITYFLGWSNFFCQVIVSMVNVEMTNAPPISNTNRIRRKLKAIAANVTKCKIDQIRLKLQYNKNSNGCRTTGRGCSKNRLGGGAYGTAYKAYASNGKTVPFVVKESTKQDISDQESKIEHDTIRVLRNAGFTENIPRVYGYQMCGMKEYLFSDLVKGVALKDFRPTSEHQLPSIITQILYTLYRINKKLPSFRHHDLHQDNVMIVEDDSKVLTIEYPVNSGQKYKFNNGGVKAVIIDFGLATVQGANNPKVSQGGYTHAGIKPNSNSIYDAHFFLNCIYLMIINPRSGLGPATNITNNNKRNKIKESITRATRFIEKHFEKRFLGPGDTPLIKGGRLTLDAQTKVTKRIGDLVRDIVLLPVVTPPGSNRQPTDLPPSRPNKPIVNQSNVSKMYKNLVAFQQRPR
jgi:serine/threonine protein kinase